MSSLSTQIALLEAEQEYMLTNCPNPTNNCTYQKNQIKLNKLLAAQQSENNLQQQQISDNEQFLNNQQNQLEVLFNNFYNTYNQNQRVLREFNNLNNGQGRFVLFVEDSVLKSGYLTSGSTISNVTSAFNVNAVNDVNNMEQIIMNM